MKRAPCHHDSSKGCEVSFWLCAKFFPGAKEFANRPSLRDATLWKMRRVAVKDFSERSKTIRIDRRREWFKKSECGCAVLVYAVVRQRKWTQQPTPHGSLMVCGIRSEEHTSELQSP